MPAPFKQITTGQFAELLSKFPFRRRINAVHMHHTWRPNRQQYRGHDTIVGMWRYHTQENGWSDIAQHITIAPDGSIWLGRDWNRPPASASGHNGNEQAGPFMFEIIGDFDKGRDPFDGKQRETVLEVIARVQQRFDLSPGTLQFHNMMSAKSCPGTGIDYQEVLRDVASMHHQVSARAVSQAGGPSPYQPVPQQFLDEAIEDLQRSTGRAMDPPDAEPCAHGTGRGHVHEARDADLGAMLPHVVNLRMGQFSSSGDWSTSREDVDAIFEAYLPAALEAARAAGRKLKLMFYAHGGLNSEADALAKTRELAGWWTANGIYPIHFVWETGLCEVLGQMLERSRQGRTTAPRNYFSDHVGDPLVEAFAHRAGGVQIWSAMKWSAQQSSAPDALGGAHYVATKLAAFCAQYPGEVELHAAGHSAGSIFHAHFIPCALDQGAPPFRSLHLMAPAVRVDLFRQQLAPRIGAGKGIDELTMYTMQDSCEKDDNCGGIYRKSLLYLIHKGLEPGVDDAILGLERCVLADPALKRLFGIGAVRGDATLVLSDNGLDRGLSASRSHTHGGFDDDPATMGSIVRRVLRLADADRIVELPQSRQAADPWRSSSEDWEAFWAALGDDAATASAAAGQPSPPPGAGLQAAGMASMAPKPAGAGSRRSALCVGIDTYPTAPLGGCVNDARAWADTLGRLGFETSTLVNQDATRDAIVGRLMALVNDSRQGDVIVFQYAGHGTQVPDLDGDESDGDTPRDDEALCPYDFASGELLIDDDMRKIFRRMPEGVNLTCFFDCCHSGTITRFAVGGRAPVVPPGKRARFITADDGLIAQYAAKRRSAGLPKLNGHDQEEMREVVFSACLSSEVALESKGHGDFTRNAIQVFNRGIAGLNNEDFAEGVTQAFGTSPAQHAKLYSSDAGRGRAFLHPLAVPAGAAAGRETVFEREFMLRQGERRAGH